MASFSWKKLKDAEVYGRGTYLKDGEYKIKVLKMFTIETRNKGAALIVDMEVMESDNDSIPVGSKRNWYQGLGDKDIAFPAIKEFLQGLFAIDLTDEDEVEAFDEGLDELMEECADDSWKEKSADDHPLNGKTVAVRCYSKETKKGQPFTVHVWSPWDGEE